MALKRERIRSSKFGACSRRGNLCLGAVEHPKKRRRPWDKENDTIAASLPLEKAEPTKRGILSKVAKIYDPLGLASPISLGGKLLYRDVCDAKRNWGDKLPNELMQNWVQWEEGLPEQLTVPRSLAVHQEEVQSIELHAFGDASGKGVAAVVYAVVVQELGVNQGLVAVRLAKKGLTIPRLELVSGYMAVNLLTNVTEALKGFLLTAKYCSLDSTVALYWIKSPGEYKQFVSNRVQKIQSHSEVIWRHVGTTKILQILEAEAEKCQIILYGGTGRSGCNIRRAGLQILYQTPIKKHW